MKRRLYHALVGLHPPAFRREFAPEMLWIYDEAQEERGAALLADALLSLARQWLLRTGCWKAAAAVAVALCQVSLTVGVMTGIGRLRPPSGFAAENPELAALVRLTAFTTVGIVAAVVFLVFCWRRLARRPRA